MASPEIGVTVDPQLRSRLSIFEFDHFSFLNALGHLGVTAEETRDLAIRFSASPHSRKVPIPGVAKEAVIRGTYNDYFKEIVLFPDEISTSLSRGSFLQPNWLETSNDRLSTVHNWVLAHETKHFIDMAIRKSDWWDKEKVDRDNRITDKELAIALCMPLLGGLSGICAAKLGVGDGLLSGALSLVCALPRSEIAYYQEREKRAYSFTNNQDTSLLFNDIIKIEYATAQA